MAECHRRGYAVTGELYMTIFERAWLHARHGAAFDRLPRRARDGPCDLPLIAELRIVQARKLAALDVDVLRLGDDVCTQKGPMMSLDTYRTFLKEPTRAIIRRPSKSSPTC